MGACSDDKLWEMGGEGCRGVGGRDLLLHMMTMGGEVWAVLLTGVSSRVTSLMSPRITNLHVNAPVPLASGALPHTHPGHDATLAVCGAVCSNAEGWKRSGAQYAM